VVHHRVPGVSKPALMISLCAACHATVERLQVVRIWLPPQLRTLWREQHPDAEYQLPLPIDPASESPSPGHGNCRRLPMVELFRHQVSSSLDPAGRGRRVYS
jgi:hypothetical protein